MDLWKALWKEIERRIIEEEYCRISCDFIECFTGFYFSYSKEGAKSFYRALEAKCEKNNWMFKIKNADLIIKRRE